jgi:DNA-damage-inducible protein J
LLMLRSAHEGRLSFDVKVPNATTRRAIAELEPGKGKGLAGVDNLMADLHAAGARSVPRLPRPRHRPPS